MPKLPRWARWRRFSQRLSVVVPLYNVEATMAATLDCILAQPVRDLEIVIVDDGSTDGSTVIARSYADRHPQIRLIVQENGGVSRARNVAIEHCTGDLVTFVDPDDLLPPDAWRPMLRALDRTGSDFAVGTMERVDSEGRRVQPPLLKRNHAVEHLGATIDDLPLMLADVFPCNKVFRMDFWRRNALEFPVDVRYEDQVLCTQAFLVASAFDVLTEVVYEWHTRVDHTSATQARGRLQNLHDRIVTKQMTIDLVRAHGNPALLGTLYRDVLPIDMWEHFRAAVSPTTAELDTYWAVLRDGLLEIWNDRTVPFEQTDLPAGQRLMGWLVGQDRRDDLARLIAQIDGPGVPVEDGRYLHPWIDEPGVPEVLSSVQPSSA
jgi:glycosyltransferase involved in cell wall biosynthesis